MEVLYCFLLPPVTAVMYVLHLPYYLIRVLLWSILLFVCWWWPKLVGQAAWTWAVTKRIAPITRIALFLPLVVGSILALPVHVLVMVVVAVFAPLGSAGLSAAMLLGLEEWDAGDAGRCKVITSAEDMASFVMEGLWDAWSSAVDTLTEERTFVPPSPPTDLNPLHLLEYLAAALVALVVVLPATIITGLVKGLGNLLSTPGIIFKVHYDGLQTDLAPCLFCCLPLSLGFGLALGGPVNAAVTIALSPLVGLFGALAGAAYALRIAYHNEHYREGGARCCWSAFWVCLQGALATVDMHDEATFYYPNIVWAFVDRRDADFLCTMPTLPTRAGDAEGNGLMWCAVFERFQAVFEKHGGELAAPAVGAVAPDINEWGVPPPPPDAPQLEAGGSNSMFEAGVEAVTRTARMAVSTPAIWNSFFNACESLAALALAEGWIPHDAVEGADPSVFIGVPALVVLQAAHRGVQRGDVTSVYLADGRVVRQDTRPHTDLADRVFNDVVTMAVTLQQLGLSEEEWTYLQHITAAGGNTEVQVPLPPSLTAAGEAKHEEGEGADPPPATGAGEGAGDAAARAVQVNRVRSLATGLGLYASRQAVFRQRFGRVLSKVV